MDLRVQFEFVIDNLQATATCAANFIFIFLFFRGWFFQNNFTYFRAKTKISIQPAGFYSTFNIFFYNDEFDLILKKVKLIIIGLLNWEGVLNGVKRNNILLT